MRGEVISVLSLERRYHMLSRVSAANEGQLSFIYPERGGFSEIFPEVMIFPEGFSPRVISSLKEIFH